MGRLFGSAAATCRPPFPVEFHNMLGWWASPLSRSCATESCPGTQHHGLRFQVRWIKLYASVRALWMISERLQRAHSNSKVSNEAGLVEIARSSTFPNNASNSIHKALRDAGHEFHYFSPADWATWANLPIRVCLWRDPRHTECSRSAWFEVAEEGVRQLPFLLCHHRFSFRA